MGEILIYDRSAIEKGELWRLVSAHFVHLSTEHLILNILGLCILSFLLCRYIRCSTLLYVIALLALLISLTLYIASPHVIRYAGLSGVLYALAGWSVFLMVKGGEKRVGVILGILISGKLLYEQLYGSVATYYSFKVITDAHLYGYLWGLAIGVVNNYNKREAKMRM